MCNRAKIIVRHRTMFDLSPKFLPSEEGKAKLNKLSDKIIAVPHCPSTDYIPSKEDNLF